MDKTLEERVKYLEEKVAQLEKQIQLREATNETVAMEHPIHQQAEQEVQERVRVVQDKRKQLKKKGTSQRKPIEWDVLIFQKILPRVFIFVLILGVLWGLKAAYDYGFITIQVILTLAILLSIAMTVIGFLQMKKDRRILGQVLIGGAIPIFMLSIFAMHQLYDMIGTTPAFIFNVIAMGVGVIFTTYFRSESIGVISLLAGVLVPYLIESTAPNFIFFASYEGILYLLFLTVALVLHFNYLYVAAGLLLHVAILALHVAVSIPETYHLVVILPIVMQQIALFFGFLYTKVSLETQAYTLLTSLLLTAVWTFLQLDDLALTVIFVGLAVLYAIGFYMYKDDRLRASIFIVNGTLAILFTFLVYDSEFMFEVALVIIFIYIYYVKKFDMLLHAALAFLLYLITFVVFHSLYLEAWVSFEMLHKVTFLIASAFLLYYFVRSTAKKNDNKLFINVGIPYFAYLLLYFANDVTHFITYETTLVDFAPLILSSFWVLIAVGWMVFSKLTAFVVGKYTGVAILFLTIAKVILLDISFMDLTIRAVLFIGLGIVGLIISRIYYKKS